MKPWGEERSHYGCSCRVNTNSVEIADSVGNQVMKYLHTKTQWFHCLLEDTHHCRGRWWWFYSEVHGNTSGGENEDLMSHAIGSKCETSFGHKHSVNCTVTTARLDGSDTNLTEGWTCNL